MGQTLWFASRATGLVALVLLTASLALGVAMAGRAAGPRWPRFALGAVHRNLSLTTLMFLAVHVSTAIIDPYAKIGWLDAVVPFISAYQPFWLGLGAVALDLMLAVLVTSIVRPRVGPRLWRAVHWSGYLCWPVAVVHGLGIGGKDSELGWVIALNGFCALVVLFAVFWRLRTRGTDPDHEARQATGAFASVRGR